MKAPTHTAPSRICCDRCQRPQGLCWCQALQAVNNRIPVHVFRHLREAAHPLNTARILALGLSNCSVIDVADRRPVDPCELPQPWLLYPGDDAVPAELVPPDTVGCLLVPDGTWRKSRAMVLASPWMQSLPRLTLSGPGTGRYSLRKCGRSGALSTVEAVVAALEALEHRPGYYKTLLLALDSMMQKQSGFRPDARNTESNAD